MGRIRCASILPWQVMLGRLMRAQVSFSRMLQRAAQVVIPVALAEPVVRVERARWVMPVVPRPTEAPLVHPLEMAPPTVPTMLW
jgi:hypothetical protein